MTAKKHSPRPHCHFPRPYETQPATSRPPSCEEKGGGRRPPHLMRLKEVAAAAPQDPRLLRGRHSGLSLPPSVHTPRARPSPAHPMTVPAPLAAAPPRMLQRVSQALSDRVRPALALSWAALALPHLDGHWGLHQASKRNRCSCVWTSLVFHLGPLISTSDS